MQYKFSPNRNYQDLAAGRVIYGSAGMPNFPVRLAQEIFCRCLEYLPQKDSLVVYDPLCGSGYLLTVLGFLNPELIRLFVGSDINSSAAALALKNLSLLTEEGLARRIAELKELYRQYRKESHLEAVKSAQRLLELVQGRAFVPQARTFTADLLAPESLVNQEFNADLIIADVPYGSLVSWQGGSATALDQFLENLIPVLKSTTIVAVCTDKKQKVRSNIYRRLEQQAIGKRRFTLLAYH